MNELNLNDSVDTLSRWMIFYLSEKIVNLESVNEELKEKLEIECCELILKIWSHRKSYNSIPNPLDKFEKVYNVLINLNSDEEWSLYSRRYRKQHDEAIYPEQEYWLNLIKETDQIVKVWIRYFVNNATIGLMDQDSKEWLELLTSIDNTESDILKLLLNFEQNVNFKESKQDKLQNSLDILEKFNQINNELIEIIQRELS